MKPKAEFGVFGGSGFYSFFRSAKLVEIETPYGFPSGKLTVSKVAGKDVAFLPRHGVHHEFPPHMVPYRANLRAFKDIGVRRVLAPNAVGSLKPDVEPGDIVFCDQFVNFTSGRRDTFFDGPETTHVSTADPYCPEMRKFGIAAAARLGMKAHPSGTVVVIQGPRFSTRAESKFFTAQGWDVINMTQYPEAVLARELKMCYLNISLVTDYDVGLEGDPRVKPVSHEEVIKVFNANVAKLRRLITEIVKELPGKRGCECGSALEHARLSA
ncbi:MAG: S-methyl-5'-thioadenosine phosphorylase [Nitrososphaerales archaeon]|nr:S-methyl-5'-thioadenosine phosphorylase [Nitrososphaerales archaeon]